MKKLIENATELAEDCSRLEEGKCASPLFDQLIRSLYGVSYAIICAHDAKDFQGKADALDNALTRSKEAKLLLSACYRMRNISEAFYNRAERRLASVNYQISKERKALDGKAEKLPKRLPRVRNVFHTRRLTVRTFLKSDSDIIMSLFGDPFYKECSLVSFENGDGLYRYLKTEPPFYAVTRRGSGEVIGAVAILSDGKGGQRVKIELGILPEFRSCGYFAELVEGACEYASNKLSAKTAALYLPSKRSYLSRALLRIGFEREGILKNYDKDGEDVTVYSYSNCNLA